MITSRIPGVTHHPFFYAIYTAFSWLIYSSQKCSGFANLSPSPHPAITRHIPAVHLLHKDTRPYSQKNQCLFWRSLEEAQHSFDTWTCLSILNVFSGLAKCKKKRNRHLFFGLHWRIPHLTVGPFQTHGGFSDKANKPSRALDAVTSLVLFPPSLTALPELASSSSRLKRLEVILISLTACPQSLLHSLYHYRWYLFYYLLLLAHRYPISLSPFENKRASLFVFQASQPRHRPDSHD